MKKLFFSFLMASCVFTTTCMANCCPSLGVSRFFVQYRNAPPEAGLTDPNAPSATSVADPYHSKMLALGNPNPIYTPLDAERLNVEAEAHFLATTGLDFSLSNPFVIYDASNDTRILTNGTNNIATWESMLFGGDGEYNVLYDSKEKKGNWTVRNPAIRIRFTFSGTFTSGTAVNQTYAPNNIMYYGYVDHLRGQRRNWHLKGHREHFIAQSLRPGSLLVNSYPGTVPTEVHAPLQYISCRGNLGYGTENVYEEQIPNVISITHNVVTFTENGF